jgi:hypothetical protein
MPSPDQISNVQAALTQINLAIPPVQGSVGPAADPNTKYQLTLLGIQLTNIQTTLTQALIAADDIIFDTDTTKLNAQAATLKTQAATINTIITDVSIAGEVAGYVAQALVLIAAI